MRKVSRQDLLDWWNTHGVALCAEAQADGVPCTVGGRACETCEHAFEAYLAAHPEYITSHSNGRYGSFPECGP